MVLGINVAGRGEQSAQQIAGLGSRIARFDTYPDADLRGWINSLHDLGIQVVATLASTALTHNPDNWWGWLQYWKQFYGPYVDYWQIGNEPDHQSPSSWTMDPGAYSHLTMLSRHAFGDNAYLIGAGLASGDTQGWPRQLNWEHVNAGACHPYAKDKNDSNPNQPIDVLFNGYKRIFGDKPLWVTEYHARQIGMAAALRDDSRIEHGLAFCFSDSMVPGFGLIEDEAALADYKAAAGAQTTQHPAPTPEPTPTGARFQAGFARWNQLHPGLLGKPKINETGVWPHKVVQVTTKGTVFWDDGDLIFAARTGRLWRWREHWDQDQEVQAL